MGGTATITELLWILICLVTIVVPTIVYLNKTKRLKLYETQFLATIDNKIRMQYQIRMSTLETLRQTNLGLIVFPLAFATAGVFAALIPPPNQNTSTQGSPTGWVIVCMLITGMIFVNIFSVRAYLSDNRADRIMNEYITNYGLEEAENESSTD